jgi:hypothetical protein
MLKQIGDLDNPNSLSAQMRQRRFVFFRDLVDSLPRPLSILDVGGSIRFWQRAEFDSEPGVTITLVNVGVPPTLPPHIAFIRGDARHMPQFADREFDIVFSNSTIEHVGDFGDQMRMAQEIQRVGKRYFVQTPNRYFPIEPHFLFPGFQFLPIATRVWLLQNFAFSRKGKYTDRAAALAAVKGIRLLTIGEMRKLFPEAKIYKEYFAGLVKSIVSYKF